MRFLVLDVGLSADAPVRVSIRRVTLQAEGLAARLRLGASRTLRDDLRESSHMSAMAPDH
eukprot:3053487-Rhodomonas_salina.1